MYFKQMLNVIKHDITALLQQIYNIFSNHGNLKKLHNCFQLVFEVLIIQAKINNYNKKILKTFLILNNILLIV